MINPEKKERATARLKRELIDYRNEYVKLLTNDFNEAKKIAPDYSLKTWLVKQMEDSKDSEYLILSEYILADEGIALESITEHGDTLKTIENKILEEKEMYKDRFIDILVYRLKLEFDDFKKEWMKKYEEDPDEAIEDSWELTLRQEIIEMFETCEDNIYWSRLSLIWDADNALEYLCYRVDADYCFRIFNNELNQKIVYEL